MASCATWQNAEGIIKRLDLQRRNEAEVARAPDPRGPEAGPYAGGGEGGRDRQSRAAKGVTPRTVPTSEGDGADPDGMTPARDASRHPPRAGILSSTGTQDEAGEGQQVRPVTTAVPMAMATIMPARSPPISTSRVSSTTASATVVSAARHRSPTASAVVPKRADS